MVDSHAQAVVIGKSRFSTSFKGRPGTVQLGGPSSANLVGTADGTFRGRLVGPDRRNAFGTRT